MVKMNTIRTTLISLAAATMMPVAEAQTPADTLLMKVGGVPVSKDEFVSAYRKNQSQLTVAAFVDRMVASKRGVCMAYEWGLDRTPAFRQSMESLTRRVEEGCLPAAMALRTETPADGKWLAHLCLRLPQHLTTARQREAEVCMDSLYRSIVAEGDLATWIRAHRATFAPSLRGEVVPWDANLLPSDLERQVTALPVGELSRPLYSAAGLHLVQWTDRGEAHVEWVSRALTEAEKRYLVQEYHDGLLNALLADSLSHVTEGELERYYKKHKKQYRWNLPYYKGLVIRARDAASLAAAVDYFDKVPRKDWVRACADYLRSPQAAGVQVECGLWRIGSHPCVDAQVFGQGTYVPGDTLAHVQTMGKVLKKKPEDYLDVRDRVRQDCLLERQRETAREAGKKFKVEINEEVLKTVNEQEAI